MTVLRFLDPKLSRPSDAHGAAVDSDAVGELGIFHRHAPREAQQVQHGGVLSNPDQSLPTRSVQLHLQRQAQWSQLLRQWLGAQWLGLTTGVPNRPELPGTP